MSLQIIGLCWGYGLSISLFFDLFQFFTSHLATSSDFKSIQHLKILEEVFGALLLLTKYLRGHLSKAGQCSLGWVQLMPLIEQSVVIFQNCPQHASDPAFERDYDNMIGSGLLFVSSYLRGVATQEHSETQLAPLRSFLQSTVFDKIKLNPIEVCAVGHRNPIRLGVSMSNYPSLGIQNIHRPQFLCSRLGHTDTWTPPALRDALTTNKLLLAFLRTQREIDISQASSLAITLINQSIDSLRCISQQTKKLPAMEQNLLFILRSSVHALCEALAVVTANPDAQFEMGTRFNIFDMGLALIPCFLPGDEVHLVEMLSVIRVAQNCGTNAEPPFPVDFFTTTVLLSEGVKASNFLLHHDCDPQRPASFYLPLKDSQLPLPFDWLFLFFHKQNQYPELLHVQQGLQIIEDLEQRNSAYIQAIPASNKIAHILHIFLLDSEIFLDPLVQKLISNLIRLYQKRFKPKKNRTQLQVDLEAAIGGQFFQFAQNFIDKFVSESYGCKIQAKCLQIFMQRALPPDIKRMVWVSLRDLWHLLLPPPDECFVFLPLDSLLTPEDDLTVIKEYANALSKNQRLSFSWSELRLHFPYWFLIHHVAGFIWNEKESSSERLQILEELVSIPKEVLADVFYYLPDMSDVSLDQTWIDNNLSNPRIALPERTEFTSALANKYVQLQALLE